MEGTRIINIDDMGLVASLFGDMDSHMTLLEQLLGVTIVLRDQQLALIGDPKDLLLAEAVIIELLERLQAGDVVDEHSVRYSVESARLKSDMTTGHLSRDTIWVTPRGRLIKPKTQGQSKFVKAIETHDVVFGIGPAGTGKTFLAVTMAVKAFKDKRVERIVITRPAVEAGESLGFLPGDLQQKIDPYLRPLYDALYEVLGMESFLKYKERGLIEVVPLAYMRGRTLDNAFIILDEAQNTTTAQMKMFLTRFGFGSKVVVNGDLTQIDLGETVQSGLTQAKNILSDVQGIAFHEFDHTDVVRHELVKRIIRAYDEFSV